MGDCPENPIRDSSYEEVMDQFGWLYRAEKLPASLVLKARWFISEAASAAIVRVNPDVVRLKGMVVLPEWRGCGYGEAMLLHMMRAGVASGYTTGEAFTHPVAPRTPTAGPRWFLERGWVEVRRTKHGMGVYRGDLLTTLGSDIAAGVNNHSVQDGITD